MRFDLLAKAAEAALVVFLLLLPALFTPLAGEYEPGPGVMVLLASIWRLLSACSCCRIAGVFEPGPNVAGATSPPVALALLPLATIFWKVRREVWARPTGIYTVLQVPYLSISPLNEGRLTLSTAAPNLLVLHEMRSDFF